MKDQEIEQLTQVCASFIFCIMIIHYVIQICCVVNVSAHAYNVSAHAYN